jgi:hypothetical protein
MNDTEEKIFNLMKSLVIADTKTIETLIGKSYALAYKYLNNLADMDKIEKHSGFWRMPGCKSEWGIHSQLLTGNLATILKTYPDAVVFREHTIPEVGLRPDAIILLKRGGEGRVFILETVNNETEESLQMKFNFWKNWAGATEYLSNLFGYVVPYFDLITSNELTAYMEGL